MLENVINENHKTLINNFNYPKDGPIDIVCGVIGGYEYNNILPWVNSIENSGFSGLKIMIIYYARTYLIDTLKNKGWLVLTFEHIPSNDVYAYSTNQIYSSPNYLTGKQFHICVERFYHIWYFLSLLPSHIKERCRYIVSTDVKDIIFQSNPFTWILNNLKEGKKIIAITESITYENETNFGAKNLTECFGNVMFEYMKKRLIYNAGTMAGEFNTMVDLFLQIYMLSMGGNLQYLQPDQAAYNILLSLAPYKDITQFMMSEDGWAAQLGTCWPHKMFEGKLAEPCPIFDSESNILYTTTHKPYVIVHQYDRIPEMASRLFHKYSNLSN